MTNLKAIDYKSTLNLPTTDFPMRAKLNEREPRILKKWASIELDRKILENCSPEKRYTLHDGPPYANGPIHLGTALGKILKDIIIRYKTMRGYYSHYVPGWDCHGLPIEQKVRLKLGRSARDKTPLEIRRLCADYALSWVKVQSEQFRRLGVGGDFANPYKTLTPQYEVGILKAFRAIVERGLIYRGRKPVYWCASCATALAEAEVEYENHISHSIYVRFGVLNPEKVKELAGAEKPAIVIWTTTPWTLPANVAVCLHPEFDYVAARIKKSGEVLIVARDLLKTFLSECGLGEAEIMAQWKGSELEGLECKHPLLPKRSLVILGEHVTLEQGTGCVHTAPGHGYEDYVVGLKYKLPMVMPVDDAGKFTDDFPLMKGVDVWGANKPIIEKLRTDGLLIGADTVEHSYPHCWRCHSPIIFRATEQWFMSMEKEDLRKKALKAIDKVRWIPTWARNRIYNMVVMRPDWCLSRQRKWGVPIPAVTCQNCVADLLELPIIDRFIEQVAQKGTDAWFSEPDESVIPEGFKCPKCGGTKFKKKSDTLDVWFDSGASHIAVCEQIEDLGSPADLYLEGSDQHRGWFQSSLLIGIGARGHAPYKAVLTHGFLLDGEGRAMHKSRGNVIPPQKIIEKMGADVLRLWVASEDYREDVPASYEIFNRISDAYRRIRNTFRFLLGNLGNFDPQKAATKYDDLPEIDQWALHKLAALINKVTRAYEDFEFHKIYHLVHTFCVVDMSALYLDIVKDRLYVEGKMSQGRRSAQTVLYEVARNLVRLLAPVLPFTMEEVYEHLKASTSKSTSARPNTTTPQHPMPQHLSSRQSVHLEDFPVVPDAWNRQDIAERWERLLALREATVKALEDARRKNIIGHSLDARVTLYTTSEELISFLKGYGDFLADFCIVSAFDVKRVEKFSTGQKPVEGFRGISLNVEKAPWEKCARCWKLHPEVGKDSRYPGVCPRCARVLAKYLPKFKIETT